MGRLEHRFHTDQVSVIRFAGDIIRLVPSMNILDCCAGGGVTSTMEQLQGVSEAA